MLQGKRQLGIHCVASMFGSQGMWPARRPTQPGLQPVRSTAGPLQDGSGALPPAKHKPPLQPKARVPV